MTLCHENNSTFASELSRRSSLVRSTLRTRVVPSLDALMFHVGLPYDPFDLTPALRRACNVRSKWHGYINR